ncbi:glycosyltransferase family 31 protein, partial [Aureobasidium melanogenum]
MLLQGPDYKSLPGAKETLVIMRTGSTELQDKLPIHLATTLLRYPDSIIFSDFEEDFKNRHIFDALESVDPHLKETSPDFDLWRRLKQYGRAILRTDELSGKAVWVDHGTGKAKNPGWKLDKFKFLPMVNRTLHEYPDKKWYIFVEPDTFIFWQNLLVYLSNLDWTKPYYLGGQINIGSIEFGQGGNGFIVSRPALQNVVAHYQTRQKEYEDFTEGHWAGDCVLGKAFKDSAGAGKSVLASIIIRHLEETLAELKPGRQSGRIAYLYLKYDTVQKIEHLIGSIVRQIIREDPLPQTLEELWKHCNNGHDVPSEDELTALLHKVTGDGPTYIVIDALDECTVKFRARFLDALGINDGNAKFLITSRYLDEFKDVAEGFIKRQIAANHDDLDLFIDYKIQAEYRLKSKLEHDHHLRIEVKYQVRDRCNGMFLLASMHMRSLAMALNKGELKELLSKLPTEVNDAYMLTLTRIEGMESNKRKLALDSLCWIIYTQRQLTIQDIQYALAVDPNHRIFDKDRIPQPDDLRDLCHGLITIVDNKIGLVHYTAQNFLNDYFKNKVPDFDAVNGPKDSVRMEGLNFATLLHRAAWRKDADLVRLLLENNADANAQDGSGHTPWSQNVKPEYKQVLRALVKGGANPSKRGHQGVSFLYHAAASGALEEVKFCLECGVDPSIRTLFDWTPLHWAAANGHFHCVRELLAAGAEHSAVSDQNKTPLDMVLGRTDRTAIEEILRDVGALTMKEILDTKGFDKKSWRRPPDQTELERMLSEARVLGLRTHLHDSQLV